MRQHLEILSSYLWSLE